MDANTPVLRLGLEARLDEESTVRWVPEGSAVSIHCGFESTAVQTPRDVQRVRAVAVKTGVYYVQHFSYADEGLYQCIRINMTRGKRLQESFSCV